jgi:hypothetical protein
MTGEDGVPSLSDAPQERCLFGSKILHRIGSDPVGRAQPQLVKRQASFHFVLERT